MAGDWIKAGKNLHTRPEVMRLAGMMDWSRDEAVGVLLRFWSWLDDVVVDADVDAVVDGVEAKAVDDVLSCDGFAHALATVGWLRIEVNPPRLVVPNFGRHNGETAKKRALKSNRQANWRSKQVDGVVDAAPSTREEKRRSNNPIVPLAFDDFWRHYPKRVAKQAAIKAWTSLNPEPALHARILADLVSRTKAGRWVEEPQFIPHPSTYLNGRRWEDEGVTAPAPRKVVAL